MTAHPAGRLPDLLRYRLVVFDVDGTLYRLGPVRRGMLKDILVTGGAPGRWTRFRILRRFRQLREELSHVQPRDFDPALFGRLSAETGRPESELRPLVSQWMIQRPLSLLPDARVAGVRQVFETLRAHGVETAIWSDYPVPEKLTALGLTARHHVWAGDDDVCALKPDPTGLLLLMDRLKIAPEDTLMIGDRLTHDGAAATAAGTDFLLISERAPRRLGPRQFHMQDYRPFLAAHPLAAE